MCTYMKDSDDFIKQMRIYNNIYFRTNLLKKIIVHFINI